MTLTRLHAALDSIVETEQLVSEVEQTSDMPPDVVARIADLVGETRELLRGLLQQRPLAV